MKGDNMKNKVDPIGNFVRHGSSSAKWTVFFTLVAVFSILAVSLAQVSYALPSSAEEFPQQLKNPSMDGDTVLKNPSGNNGVPYNGIALKYAEKPDGTKVPVYCLEVWRNYPGSGSHEFNKVDSTDLMSPGVVALLTYAHETVYPNIESNLEGTRQEQGIVQLALWAYLYDTNPTVKAQANSAGAMTDESRAKIDSGSWGSAVKPLVEYAKANDTKYGNPVVEVQKSGEWQLSEDEKYMVSPEMTINATPEGALKNFKIEIDGAPSNTKVLVNNQSRVDEMALSELLSQTFSNSVKIQLKVPKEEVTEKSKQIYVTAVGNYRYFVGYGYVTDGDYQTIAAGTVQDKTASGEVELNVQYNVTVPETGQNSSVALYIIGLIVLLCGTGVIYANVKPAKEK